MGIVISKKRKLFDNQIKSLKYVIDIINSSPIKDYVDQILLYGSCARREQSWNSDVDICVILKDDIENAEWCNELIHTTKSEFMHSNFADIDAKFLFKSNFDNVNSLFNTNVRKDGIKIWPLPHI